MAGTKSRTMRMLVACFVVCFCAAIVATALAADQKKNGGGKPAAKWQHLALTHDVGGGVSSNELGKRIIKLGQGGWELVCVENFSKSGTTTKTVFYFKKPL